MSKASVLSKAQPTTLCLQTSVSDYLSHLTNFLMQPARCHHVFQAQMGTARRSIFPKLFILKAAIAPGTTEILNHVQ